MNEYRGNRFDRISKTAAKKLYESGAEVYAAPCKMNPESIWFSPFGFQINEENGADFQNVVNAATYYQCNYETGYYLAFYKEV